MCTLCNRAPENIEHLLLNCHNAQIVWHNLGTYAQVQSLRHLEKGPLPLLSHLITAPLPLPNNLSSKTLIPYALWHIWKSRNRNIFDNTKCYPNTSHIIGEATKYDYIINNKACPKTLSLLSIKWHPPP
uniref:Uncharacterized protein LOC104214172 n=1 Tax=Nicotiana sylvestris TaxID=4096 RepID=A0A1U7V1H9_NICSY|nr:PREDICTED: uncharacterized protein LOC104214172 [Nicotiana sylvestris]